MSYYSPKNIETRVFDAFNKIDDDNFLSTLGHYFKRMKALRKYRKYIYDEKQTELTKTRLINEIEKNYDIKFQLLNWGCSRWQYGYAKYLNIITTEKKDILNKLIPKLKTNMIARQKKQFLINIQSANLPHDLENLIFTYLY
jgi:hypothetical protein